MGLGSNWGENLRQGRNERGEFWANHNGQSLNKCWDPHGIRGHWQEKNNPFEYKSSRANAEI